MQTRSGGEILVRALTTNGVDTVFCVPGESYIAVLDALHDSAIKVITCRHEAGAANMAEAQGKLSGRPGIAFVTRGPGATHASIGVHTAMQDSTPMILFIGQVARSMRGREAFQEVDYAQMFGPLAKWAAQIDDARRIPEFVARAFHVAMSGRPGPVVLALPEDMLRDRVEVADLARVEPAAVNPGADDLQQMRRLLAHAERPLLIVGGSGWDARACAALRSYVERSGLPVLASWRRQSLLDNRSPCYVGHMSLGMDPKLAESIRTADVIVALGGRLSEVPTDAYTLIEAPRPRARFIHVHADLHELGRVYEADLAINASPGPMAHALAALEPLDGSRWSAWRAQARAAYEQSLNPSQPAGALDLVAMVRGLSERLPQDAIMCNGAGNFAAWLHRFFEYKGYGTQLAPTSGAMGYGLPAAIGAKLRYPDRTVIAFTGDGDFLMSGHEMATAAQYGVAVIVLVFNNGMYGTIRMHQERHYPGRVVATELHNPDFMTLAKAYGAYGARVERTEEFEAALQGALASKLPALIELCVDPDAITPRTTLSALKAAYTPSLR